MKFHKVQITCQKYAVEFVRKIDYVGKLRYRTIRTRNSYYWIHEKYINDTAWDKGWVKPVKVNKELKQSIGIIGAGPAVYVQKS